MKKQTYSDRFRNVLIDATERRMVREHHFEPFIKSVIEDFTPLLSDAQIQAIADVIDSNTRHNPNTLNKDAWIACSAGLNLIIQQRKNQQHEAENPN